MLAIFQNTSRNRYDKKNPFRSAYVCSIEKMDFWLKFKPRIDSRERGFIFINDLPYIFEYICSIAMINSFDVLEDFDTDRNEVILINTE